jgi:hypothetical protein
MTWELQDLRFILVGLAALVSGCGKTSEESGSGSTAQPQLVCNDTLPARELSLLSEESTDVTMGPCGELSYSRSGQVYLADSSLSQAQLLDGATALPTFDPRGHGMFYLGDESRTLVYRELRGENRWSAPLPPPPLHAVDFYSKPGESGVFRCEGESIVDYDPAGNATIHALGLHCPNALHSGLDALLLAPGRDGYVSVTLGTWQTRVLEDAGDCTTDSCEMTLIRRVLRKQPLVTQLMGDYFAPVPAGPPRYYDGKSGAELQATALVPPDRHVVAAPGHPIYMAEDLTIAITDDSRDGRDETVLRYFGPSPGQPERWSTSSLVLAPRRASLRALPARAFERVAVWSEDCAQDSPRTQLTFVPGSNAESLDIDGCVLRVHWVGSDGTLLAQVWLDGTEWPSIYGAPLALIRPGSRLDLLDIDVQNVQGVRQVLSNGRTLAIATGYGGPLYVVDLETAASREAAPAADRLLTDDSRERLAFRASYGPGSTGPLWAGAFPH